MISEAKAWLIAFIEAIRWHYRNIRGSLNGSVDLSYVVAEYALEWSCNIFPRSIKNKQDPLKTTIKGVTVNRGNGNLHFISKSPYCANCGLKASKIVIVAPTQVEIQKTARAYGYIKYVGQIGDKWYPMTIDHIRPRAMFGPDHDTNKQVLCGPCNHMKGCRMMSIPFPTYTIPKTTLIGGVKQYINLLIMWHNTASNWILTIDR